MEVRTNCNINFSLRLRF